MTRVLVSFSIFIFFLIPVIFCDYPSEYTGAGNFNDEEELYGIEILLPPDVLYEKKEINAELKLILSNGEKKDAHNSEITWSSLDTAIAVIDGRGRITGVQPGIAEIRAQYGIFSAKNMVVVEKTIDCSRIFLSEVFYDAIGRDTGYEFIEIYNGNEEDCDISGFYLLDGNSKSRPFTFPVGTVIEKGRALVVSDSGDDFQSLFGFYPDYTGIGFTLNNNGETVILYGAGGFIQDIVYIEGGYGAYIPDDQWGSASLPASPEGDSVVRIGFTIERTHSNWTGSAASPGSI